MRPLRPGLAGSMIALSRFQLPWRKIADEIHIQNAYIRFPAFDLLPVGHAPSCSGQEGRLALQEGYEVRNGPTVGKSRAGIHAGDSRRSLEHRISTPF